MKSIRFLFGLAFAATALRGQDETAKTPNLPPPPGVSYSTNIVYGKGGSQDLLLDLAAPKNVTAALPAVVFIHGGGWSMGDKLQGQFSIYQMAQAGFVAVSVQYRLANDSTIHAPEVLADCNCAIRFLRANAAQYHVDPAHIGIMGSSAGGHIVCLLGVTNGDKEFEGDGGWADQSSDVQAVVDWFGPIDLVVANGNRPRRMASLQSFVTGLAAGTPPAVVAAAFAKLNPVNYLVPGKSYPPFLILHGDSDKSISVEQSKMWAATLSKYDQDVTLHVLPGMGHGMRTVNDPQWWPEVIRFLKRTLKLKSTAV